MLDRTLLQTLDSERTLKSYKSSSPPVLPLPMFKGVPPVLLVFEPDDLTIGIAYETQHVPGSPMIRATNRESTLYCIPRLTPVLAASGGKVVQVRKEEDGHRVVIKHCHGWLTIYRGITYPVHEQRWATRVKTGTLIGHLASSRAGPMRPLYFELWRAVGEHDYERIDPIRHMRRWRHIDLSHEVTRARALNH